MSANGEKTVHVQYFAMLREQRGLSKETLATHAPSAAALYEELRAQHGFTLPLERMRVIVNEAFQPWDVSLSEGDTIVFVPPVAGG
ncbi:MAG: MoaD/ThiS family protein [Candidatus Hydrogenedentes bacterium]|nr:MoaD/ThiS family protein [Candidatus Hydrogenedentota bacterium]